MGGTVEDNRQKGIRKVCVLLICVFSINAYKLHNVWFWVFVTLHFFTNTYGQMQWIMFNIIIKRMNSHTGNSTYRDQTWKFLPWFEQVIHLHHCMKDTLNCIICRWHSQCTQCIFCFALWVIYDDIQKGKPNSVDIAKSAVNNNNITIFRYITSHFPSHFCCSRKSPLRISCNAIVLPTRVIFAPSFKAANLQLSCFHLTSINLQDHHCKENLPLTSRRTCLADQVHIPNLLWAVLASSKSICLLSSQ